MLCVRIYSFLSLSCFHEDLARFVPPKKPPRKGVSKIADTSYKADNLSSSSCTMLTIHEHTDGASRNSGGGGGQGSDVATGTPTDDNKLDSKTEDDSSATLSVSSVEVEQDDHLKFASSHNALQESRSGYSDDEIRDMTDGKNGHRVHTFTSTPKRPGKLFNLYPKFQFKAL